MSCSKSRRYRKLSLIVQETANPLHSLSESLLWPLKRSTCESRFDSVRLTSFKNVHMEGVLCGGSRDHAIATRCSGGIQVKGAGPPRRAVLDLRSDSQEKSCGVGLHGFESHPPHHFTLTSKPTAASCLAHCRSLAS